MAFETGSHRENTFSVSREAMYIVSTKLLNMLLKIICSALLLLNIPTAFSQKSRVYDELKSALSYGEDAGEKADEVLDYIRKASSRIRYDGE